MRSYTVFAGSTRNASQSGKVARWVAGRISENDAGSRVTLVDLATTRLPQWDESFWEDEAAAGEEWLRVAAALKESDGLVFVTPEWNGMVPPPLLNVFLLASRGEIAHRPALIVAVSAGSGGAYPVIELRAFGYKNTQVCWLPDHVIVRRAGRVLNGPEPQDETDDHLRERIDYSVRLLAVYAEAFKAIRASGAIDLETYPYGM